MLKEISEREKDLKEQLNLYTAKYDDFQNSLQKSNDIFATYKVELEKVSDQKLMKQRTFLIKKTILFRCPKMPVN